VFNFLRRKIMDDAQIFQILGLTYLAVGIGFLLNEGSLKRLLAACRSNTPLLFFSGILTLLLGFIMVTFHNDWHCHWGIIITIIGWLALIKGLTILILPNAMDKILIWYENKLAMLKYYPLIIIIVGAFLAILGFFVV